MKSKFILFVLFASVAHSCVTLVTSSSSLNQTEIHSKYSTIATAENQTLDNFVLGFNTIFDAIIGCSEDFANGNLNTTEGDLCSTEIAAEKVIAAFMDAHENIEEGIQALQLTNSSAVSTNQDEVSAAINNLVNRTFTAVELILQSKNYSTTLAEIEAIEEEVIYAAAAIIDGIFDEIANVSNTSDVQAVNAIETTRDRAVADIKVAFLAVFGAIKNLLAQILYKVEAESETSIFEMIREIAILVMTDEVRAKYNLIRALYKFLIQTQI